MLKVNICLRFQLISFFFFVINVYYENNFQHNIISPEWNNNLDGIFYKLFQWNLILK